MENKTVLLNGNSQASDLTFWKLWTDELPGSFPKMKLIEELSGRWGIAQPNVYNRLQKENFMNLKSDLAFLFNRYGIAFDIHERGFFLDRRQFDIARQNEELEEANLLGLGK